VVNRKVDEAVFDAILEQAFSDVIEEDFEKLKSESESCTISSETDLKIRKMIAKAGKADQRKLTRTVLRIASVVLVVMLNLGLIGILMVPSVNAEVKNVFADLFEKYVSFETTKNNRTAVTTREYEIGYIPERFELTQKEETYLRFDELNQGDKYILINISDEDFSRMSFNSENTVATIVDINGTDAHLNYFDDNYILFWYNGYHFFAIYSNIPEHEIVKIAENVKKLE